MPAIPISPRMETTMKAAAIRATMIDPVVSSPTLRKYAASASEISKKTGGKPKLHSILKQPSPSNSATPNWDGASATQRISKSAKPMAA